MLELKNNENPTKEEKSQHDGGESQKGEEESKNDGGESQNGEEELPMKNKYLILNEPLENIVEEVKDEENKENKEKSA